MENQDSIVSQYIAKVMVIQETHQNRPLNEQDLQLISQELNLSEEDIKIINQEFKGYLHRGIGFMKFKNWPSAIDELEQALCLKPYHYGALVSLSAANEQLYFHKKDKKLKERALDLSRRCLQVDPSNEDALRIISNLEMDRKGRLKQSANSWAFKGVVVFSLLGMVLATQLVGASIATVLTFFAIIVFIFAAMMLVVGMM